MGELVERPHGPRTIAACNCGRMVKHHRMIAEYVPTGGIAEKSNKGALSQEKPRGSRRGVASFAPARAHMCERTASSSSAMMLVILIAGFTAGPAVSL